MPIASMLASLFDWADHRPICGDSLAHEVAWKQPLSALRDRPVRLEFRLRNARLWALELAN
jgi:hypothetical protein